MSKEMSELETYFKRLGRKSAEARMQNMTSAQRRAIAKKAAQARWKKQAQAEEADARSKGRALRKGGTTA